MRAAVRLVPMSPQQFQEFVAASVVTYAAEEVAAGRSGEADGVRHAQAQFDQLLPRGAATPDHWFAITLDAASGARVGHVWWSMRPGEPRSGFVFDLFVEADQRRKGYAEATLRAVEDDVRGRGADRIGLHVFARNRGAIALYEKLGFEMTGHTMLRRFAGPAPP